MIPTIRFPPFPCRSQEVATSSLFSVVVPGLNSGTQPSLSEILHLEIDVLCHSQDNDFHKMAPPKHWDFQNLVYSHSKTVKVATDCGLFGRQTHGALQCSCYLSKGHQRAVCSSLLKTLQGDPTSQSKEKSILNILIGRSDADVKTPVVWPPDE